MTKLTAQCALTIASAISALALGTSTAVAQNNPQASATVAQNAAAAPAAAGGLEEVVVTARYREENLQQTPIAITAITAEDIETRGFTTAADVAYSVPNASFRPAQQAFGNTVTAFIRGVGQNDFNFAFEPGVGVYVDDVYYPTVMGTQFDLMDLDRVEVLRGPQGTLFGRGSIGGAIRYVSKKPRGDNTGFIEGTAGEFHRVDLRGGFDFAIIPDKLFARITGVAKKQDGYQNDYDYACLHPTDGLAGTLPATSRNRGGGCKIGTLGGTDVNGARAQFRYAASDALDFGLALDYQRDDSEARADTLVAIGPMSPGFAFWDSQMFAKFGVHYDSRFLTNNPFATYDTFTDPYSGLTFPPKTSLNQKGVAGTADWKINDAVAAKLILAWRNWNGKFSTDQDGSPLGLSVVDGLQQFTYRTVELRFEGRLFDKLDWTVGGFYYLGNGESTQQVELPGVLPPPALPPGCTSFTQTPPPAGVATCDTRSIYYRNPTGVSATGLPNALLVDGKDVGRFQNASGFIHGVYALTDRLHLEFGGRYSDDKKHDDFDNTVFKAPVDSNGTRFDWRLGITDQFTDTVMGYATASTGYRPPAYNPRPFQQSQFKAVAGENLTQYELGAKSDWFGHKLRVNPAAFYSDYKQRIVAAGGVECLKTPTGQVIPGPLPNPEGGPTCLVNSIPLTAYVNAPGKIYGGELELTFAPTTALLFTASAGYTKFSANATSFQNRQFTGLTPNSEPPYVPEWNGAASVQYTFDLPTGGTITPRYDAYLQTQICTGNGVLGCSAGYTLQNVRIEYATTDRTWTAAFGINNVGDKVYFLNKFDLTVFGEPTVEGQPGMPRAWYLTLTRNFR